MGISTSVSPGTAASKMYVYVERPGVGGQLKATLCSRIGEENSASHGAIATNFDLLTHGGGQVLAVVGQVEKEDLLFGGRCGSKVLRIRYFAGSTDEEHCRHGEGSS
jgi:hypothetical protein